MRDCPSPIHAVNGSVIVVHGLMTQGKSPADFADKIQDAYTLFWRTRLPPSWLPLPLNSIHVLSAEEVEKYGIVNR